MMSAIRTFRWVAAPLVLAALGASAPIVRWCPVGSERVPLEILVRCSLAAEGAPPNCSASSAMPRAGVAICERRPLASMPCAEAGGCPMRSARPDESGGPGETAASAPAATAPGSSVPAHGRAFCLDAPALSAGTQSHAPTLDPPGATPALVALQLAMAPPEPLPTRTHSESEARPPTRDTDSRPPVRGPPPRG